MSIYFVVVLLVVHKCNLGALFAAKTLFCFISRNLMLIEFFSLQTGPQSTKTAVVVRRRLASTRLRVTEDKEVRSRVQATMTFHGVNNCQSKVKQSKAKQIKA